MRRNMKMIMQDHLKKVRYVCRRIPDEGIRIELTSWTSENPPVWALVTPIGFDEVTIESNEPEWVDLDLIYNHFRRQEMTYEELWKDLRFVDPEKEYRRKVDSLSQNERELFEAASETQPVRGEALASMAGHDYNGQIKGRLSLLVKLGLLTQVRGGYLKVRQPVHPYAATIPKKSGLNWPPMAPKM